MIPMGGHKIAPNPALIETQSRYVFEHGTDGENLASRISVSAVRNRMHLRWKAIDAPSQPSTRAVLKTRSSPLPIREVVHRTRTVVQQASSLSIPMKVHDATPPWKRLPS